MYQKESVRIISIIKPTSQRSMQWLLFLCNLKVVEKSAVQVSSYTWRTSTWHKKTIRGFLYNMQICACMRTAASVWQKM